MKTEFKFREKMNHCYNLACELADSEDSLNNEELKKILANVCENLCEAVNLVQK